VCCDCVLLCLSFFFFFQHAAHCRCGYHQVRTMSVENKLPLLPQIEARLVIIHFAAVGSCAARECFFFFLCGRFVLLGTCIFLL
jgi:hypothetical protein